MGTLNEMSQMTSQPGQEDIHVAGVRPRKRREHRAAREDNAGNAADLYLSFLFFLNSSRQRLKGIRKRVNETKIPRFTTQIRIHANENMVEFTKSISKVDKRRR